MFEGTRDKSAAGLYQMVSLSDCTTTSSIAYSNELVATRDDRSAFRLTPLTWLQNNFRGWHRTVLAGTGLAFVILTVNFILMVIGLAKFDRHVGYGTLYTDEFAKVKRVNTGLHLLINIVSTTLLGACTFTMQCLTSPTRSEIDRAHAKGKTLDIGISSARNLLHINRYRAVLWILLGASSLPLHVFWNSVIFVTTTSNAFTYLIVDEGFLSDDSYALPPHPVGLSADNISYMHDLQVLGKYERLDVPECISLYGTPYISQKRYLLAVTTPVNGTTVMAPGIAWQGASYASDNSSALNISQPLWNGSSLIAYNVVPNDAPVSDWTCNGYDDIVPNPTHVCDTDYALRRYQETGTWWLRPHDPTFKGTTAKYPVDYCLSYIEPVKSSTISYVPSYISVVVLCNLVKVVSMLLTVRILRGEKELVCATVGDAVASFLESPEPRTRNMSLIGYKRQWMAFVKTKAEESDPKPLPLAKGRTMRLFAGTSKIHWSIALFVCLAYLVAAIATLIASIAASLSTYPSVQSVLGMGVGTPIRNISVPVPGGNKVDLSYTVAVANSFHVALTVAYYFYGSLVTSQCAAMEWASFAGRFRPLRVTNPVGGQTTSYFLHTPFRVSICINICWAVLHWLISVTVFSVRVAWYSMEDIMYSARFVSSVGYSPTGLLSTCCVGAALILALLLHSLRPLDARIPPHGNLSIAISAACHPRESERIPDAGGPESMVTKPLRWGVIVEPQFVFGGEVGIPHCSFSATQVRTPEPGHKYV